MRKTSLPVWRFPEHLKLDKADAKLQKQLCLGDPLVLVTVIGYYDS